MASANISDSLRKKIEETLKESVPGVTRIDASIFNPKTNEEIKIDFIDKLDILQDFENDYSDNIVINFKLSPDDYLKIKDEKDLFINLIFNKIDKNGNTIPEYKPEKRKYSLLFTEKSDIEKLANPNDIFSTIKNVINEALNSAQIDLEAQLVEKEFIDIKKKQTKFIASNISMKDCILYFLSLIGVEKCFIDEVGINPKTYGNVIIPPFQNMKTFFKFIQERYGVYKEGLGFYYTEKTVYVYPLYSFKHKSENGLVNIYKTVNNYLGLDAYVRQYEGKNDLDMVSVSENSSFKLEDKGVENIGNSFFYVDGSTYMDSFTNSATGTEINPFLTQAKMFSKDSVTENSFYGEYKGVKRNIYPEESMIARYSAEYTEVTVFRSIPFMFLPHMNFLYHYSGKEKYKTQRGSIMKAIYSFAPDGEGGDTTFNCICNFILALDNLDKK